MINTSFSTQPFITFLRQTLRATPPQEWSHLIQSCSQLSQACHNNTLDPARLKSVQMHLLGNPATALKVALIMGLTRRIQRHTSLETIFDEEATTINLENPPNFHSCLVPNETEPLGIVPHLVLDRPGIFVATGTERAFFALLLLLAKEPTKCQGLVVRDFNPEVKAYVDFLVLLLRISDNREDFARLSRLFEDDEYKHNLDEESALITWQLWTVERRIENSPYIPPDMKEYFRNGRRFWTFGQLYYHTTAKHDWSKRQGCFEGVNYLKNNELFNRLQKFARAGKIIATVGKIDDLAFLEQKRNIALMDIWNIPDYTIPNFQLKSRPRIISTTVVPLIYRSSVYAPIEPSQAEELTWILELFKRKISAPDPKRKAYRFGGRFSRLLAKDRGISHQDLLNQNPALSYYSIELFEELRRYLSRTSGQATDAKHQD